jgi:protein-S-isoprenylcysteine O-methyltransferase Ste14
MEAIVTDQVVALTLDQRIHRMHQRDRIGAIAFVVVLWVTILFVLFSVWPAIGNEAIRAILVVAGGLVLAFNTAAIVAMLRHYHGDKVFIYSLDIMHLDEMRRRRRR